MAVSAALRGLGVGLVPVAFYLLLGRHRRGQLFRGLRTRNGLLALVLLLALPVLVWQPWAGVPDPGTAHGIRRHTCAMWYRCWAALGCRGAVPKRLLLGGSRDRQRGGGGGMTTSTIVVHGRYATKSNIHTALYPGEHTTLTASSLHTLSTPSYTRFHPACGSLQVAGAVLPSKGPDPAAKPKSFSFVVAKCRALWRPQLLPSPSRPTTSMGRATPSTAMPAPLATAPAPTSYPTAP